MQRTVRLGGDAQPERLGERRGIALEVAVHRGQPEAWRQQRGARVQREGVPPPRAGRDTGHLAHELPRPALGGEVRRDLVHAIRVGLAPRFQEIRRLRQPEALAVVPLDPRERLEPLHDVVRVPEADLARLGQLLEAPGAAGRDQERSNDAGGARREERAEGPGRGADVSLAFFLDQHVL